MKNNTVSMSIRRNLEIDGERFALVVETLHGPVRTLTAVHVHDFPRTIGGVRFVEQGTLSELGHLSSAMTKKCLAAGLPAGGQKSLVICPHGIPASYEDRAAILSAHVRTVAAEDPGVIFGPDMSCPEAVMDLLAEDPAIVGNVTGLDRSHGGLAIDANGYTGYGLGQSIALAISEGEIRQATIQGFGAVGIPTAAALVSLGVNIRGVSAMDGALIARGGRLDMAAILGKCTSSGEASLQKLAEVASEAVYLPNPDELLDEPTDLFVPAARTMVLAMQDEIAQAAHENPHVRSVETFLERTGVKLVAEGANYPLSYNAERFLEVHGVRVLPDVMVNLGGLVGCFFEWAFRREILASPEGFEVVGAAARDFICRCIDANVRSILSSRDGGRSALMRTVAANRVLIRERFNKLEERANEGQARDFLAPWILLGVG